MYTVIEGVKEPSPSIVTYDGEWKVWIAHISRIVLCIAP